MLTQFEYPLPELSADIDEIEVETHSVCEGSFFIRNIGGGRLSGQIISHNACAVLASSALLNSKQRGITFLNSSRIAAETV